MSDEAARQTPSNGASSKDAAKPDAAIDAKADPRAEPKADAAKPEASAAKAADAKPADPKESKAEVDDDAETAKAPEVKPAAKDPPKSEAKPEAEADAPKAPGEIKLRLFGRTDVGQVREHNEDNFIVADLTKNRRGLMEADRSQLVGDRGTLLGVCDGMGGAAAGEVASQLAVDIIYQKMSAGDVPQGRDDIAARLVQSIEAAGVRIFSEAKLDRTRRGMGTTSTIAALVDDHLFLGQVGDSRGYILRGDRLVQVTRDQSLVNQLIEAGQLTEEEAETFEHNNIILQALGTADTVQVDLTFVKLKKGDTLLLCSDGLSGMVRNDEIREVLLTVDDPLEACKTLTERANQAGGHDNITVVVAKFEGPGLDDPTKDDVAALKYMKYQLPEPPMPTGPVAEPSRRMKDLDQQKVSVRPSGRGKSSAPPEVEIRESDDDDLDGSDDDDDGGPPRPIHAKSDPRDEPIQIPTEGAPTWLVTMMIVSAVMCVVIASYYLLLRPH